MLGDKDVSAVLAQKDLAAGRKFYEETLGLTVAKETDDGGVLYKSGQGFIFLYESGFAGTNQATAAAWNVDDVSAVAEGLKAKGVTLEHYDLPGVTMEGDVHVMGPVKAIWFMERLVFTRAIRKSCIRKWSYLRKKHPKEKITWNRSIQVPKN